MIARVPPGVTELSIVLPGRAAPLPGYVFEPHRLALPCWARALRGRPPALLVSLDRHFDLVPPAPLHAPDAPSIELVDELTTTRLDARNFDHVLAAMELGLVGDALCVARAAPAGSFAGRSRTDARGREHRIVRAPALAPLTRGGPLAAELHELLRPERPLLLDVDLDVFTTSSDADPTEPIPWPAATIRRFLLPEGGAELWATLRARVTALTLAREPNHVGGLVAEARLFLEVAPILFSECLGAEPP